MTSYYGWGYVIAVNANKEVHIVLGFLKLLISVYVAMQCVEFSKELQWFHSRFSARFMN